MERWPTELLGWFTGLLASFGLPGWCVALASMLVIIGTIIGVFMGMFALTSLVERKGLARMQNRIGPNRVGPFGLLQPVADGVKMLFKEDIVPSGADKAVHFLAPVATLVPALMALAILPYGDGMTPVRIETGILFYFALSAGTEVGVFMAGWAGNSKYPLLGAMRAIAQMMCYELPLVISAVSVAMVCGSLGPWVMAEAQAGYYMGLVPKWFVFTPWGMAGFVTFFIALLAEANRSPFDLPEGESEIVAGHLTEYSGFKYAIFFMAEYVGLFAVCGLCVALFLGGWQAPSPLLAWVPSWCWFLGKLYALVLAAIWIRGTVPRIRIDQLMGFAWTFLLPMSLAVMIGAAAWHYAGRGVAGWLISGVIVAGAYLVLGARFGKAYPMRRYRYAE